MAHNRRFGLLASIAEKPLRCSQSSGNLRWYQESSQSIVSSRHVTNRITAPSPPDTPTTVYIIRTVGCYHRRYPTSVGRYPALQASPCPGTRLVRYPDTVGRYPVPKAPYCSQMQWSFAIPIRRPLPRSHQDSRPERSVHSAPVSPRSVAQLEGIIEWSCDRASPALPDPGAASVVVH